MLRPLPPAIPPLPPHPSAAKLKRSVGKFYFCFDSSLKKYTSFEKVYSQISNAKLRMPNFESQFEFKIKFENLNLK